MSLAWLTPGFTAICWTGEQEVAGDAVKLVWRQISAVTAAFDVDAVGGAGGGGPVELDLVADSLGGEVGDELGKIE